MPFVVYHTRSTVKVGPDANGNPSSYCARTYKFEANARKAMQRFNARDPLLVGPGPYAFASVDHWFSRVVRMVERTNLMSGEKYMESSDTPLCCSPSSETYWSM